MIDRFPEALLDQIRAAVPISQVVDGHVQWDKGNGGGNVQWACCPLHGESTPSFKVDDSEGFWKCHGCGKGGDQFRFLMELDSVEFPDAVRAVALMGGIALPDEPAGDRKPSRPPEHPRKGNDRPQPSSAEGKREITARYDYTDRVGNLIYQVCRFQIRMPDGTFALTKDRAGTWKTFLQRRPSGLADGSWVWGLSAGDFMRPGPGKDWSAYDAAKKANWPDAEVRTFTEGADHTIYRHPAVEIAIAEGKSTLIVEGEKDADTAAVLGFCGTTNSSGSKHWTDVHAANFRGADVVICLDNDEAGDRADHVAMTLRGIARSIRVLNFADHVDGFTHKGDLTDWVEKFGGDASKLGAIINTLPEWRPRPPVSKFGATTMTQIASKPIVYDWLIKHLIERQGILVVAGETGAGKTFFTVDMGMKIARGLEYGGRKVKQGLVVYIASEDGKGVKLRVEGYRVDNDISRDLDVPFVVLDPQDNGAKVFSLMSDESVDEMIKECLDLEAYYGQKLEMIFIDTISAAAEGLDENSSGEATKMLARANRLRTATKATVCLVHHMNANATKMRGSTAIPANVPNIIELRPVMTIPTRRDEKPVAILDKEGRPLRRAVLTKNKNGLADVKWTFCLKIVPIGLDEDGEERTTCVCTRAARSSGSSGTEEEVTKLVGDQKMVFDALVSAQTDKGQDVPTGAAAPPQQRRCVSQTAFVASIRKVISFKAGEEEIEARNTELQAFLKRTTTALINAGYMGRDNDQKIVWWTGKSDRPRPRYSEPERPQEQPGAGMPDEIKRELAEEGPPF